MLKCAGRGNKMRRSKQRMPTVEPEEEDVEENADESDGFFACYLLCSLCPRFKGHTYIGFTVNPRRRIRQHNGEIRCGAWRTKSKRPWEMVLCIHGFPSKVSALQFEWAWQHPRESKAVRDALSGFKSLSGLANKIKLAFTMLSLPQWDRFNLSLNFFSTKYAAHSAHCPRLPKHMRTTVLPMAELPCYSGNPNLDDEDDDDDDDDGDELDHVLEEGEAHPSDPISLCHPKDGESDEEAMRMQIHDHGYDPDEEHDHIHEPISQNHPMIAESDEELDDKQKKDYDHDHDHEHDLEEREEQIDVCLSLSRPKSKLGPRGASLLDVIDLSTPPSCRRGRSSICVEVIDLTGSPA